MLIFFSPDSVSHSASLSFSSQLFSLISHHSHHHHHQQHHCQNQPPSRSQSQSHHQHYYPTTLSSSSSASFKGCCCYLFLLFSFLALLILAVVLVIILAVKPKKPSFDLQQVGVQYMGITTPITLATDPTTSASLSLNIQMLFTAVNPNSNLSHVAFGSGG